jgi:hypothetical protein
MRLVVSIHHKSEHKLILPFLLRIRIQDGKNDPHNRKTKEISRFQVMYAFYLGMKTSPVAWTSLE